METISSTPTTPAGVRNTFLTVICILTFIGSGWGVIKSIREYAGADTISTIAGGAIQNAQDQMDQENTPSFVKQIMSSVMEGLSAENIRKLAIIKFISNLFTLFGAILMWNLRKGGFYLYLAGIIVLMMAPLVIGKLMGVMSFGFSGFVGVIFIIMYAVNLKSMNPGTQSNVS